MEQIVSNKQGHAYPDKACVDPLRIVVIDDSTTVRAIIERILEPSRQFDVVASVPSAQDALAFLKDNIVDIIILDIEMPTGNGLDAMPDLLAASEARILVLSSLAEPGGAAAVRALSLGACDTLAKPGRSSFAGQFSQILCEKLTSLGRSVARELVPAKPVIMRDNHSWKNAVGCIGIGSSTGGIPAIQALLENLSPDMTAPILITQHLPTTFIPFLVRQLDDGSERKVVMAVQGQLLELGTVYVAPADGHLRLIDSPDGNRIDILHEARGRYMPSVDPMFESIAERFKEQAVAIVLSGMGRDGLLGAEKVADFGGQVLAQDPASSVVWGMPGVVARSGLASAILPPSDLATHICRNAGHQQSLDKRP